MRPNLAKEIPTHHNFKFFKAKVFCFSVLDPVTDDEVFNEIKRLNENKSSGYDDISLKEISSYIVKHLTHIFNLSFLVAEFQMHSKLPLQHQYIRKMISILFQIAGQYPYYPASLRY